MWGPNVGVLTTTSYCKSYSLGNLTISSKGFANRYIRPRRCYGLWVEACERRNVWDCRATSSRHSILVCQCTLFGVHIKTHTPHSREAGFQPRWRIFAISPWSWCHFYHSWRLPFLIFFSDSIHYFAYRPVSGFEKKLYAGWWVRSDKLTVLPLTSKIIQQENPNGQSGRDKVCLWKPRPRLHPRNFKLSPSRSIALKTTSKKDSPNKQLPLQ